MKRLRVLCVALVLAGCSAIPFTGEDDADDFRVPMVCWPKHTRFPAVVVSSKASATASTFRPIAASSGLTSTVASGCRSRKSISPVIGRVSRLARWSWSAEELLILKPQREGVLASCRRRPPITRRLAPRTNGTLARPAVPASAGRPCWPIQTQMGEPKPEPLPKQVGVNNSYLARQGSRGITLKGERGPRRREGDSHRRRLRLWGPPSGVGPE
jgi:hypothetical protein